MKDSTIQLAKGTLLLEAQAIINMSERLTQDTLDSVALLFKQIHQEGGHLHCCGVGKSGLIAKKISSTFCSLGLPSSFLHPTEALHGDIGRVGPRDLLLVISKSGSSEELQQLLLHISLPKERIIALLGQKKSLLSDYVGHTLDCYVEKEACMNNLAPTTSTTATMAMGDVLAVLYQSVVGHSKEDFAKNHPSGLLGKSLTLKVSDLLIPLKDCAVLPKESTLREVIIRLTERPLGLCAFLNEQEQLLGIIVDGDIRRCLANTAHALPLEITAEELFNPHPVVIQKEAKAIDALYLMEKRERQISVLPVLEGEKFVGLLRLHDLVRAGLII